MKRTESRLMEEKDTLFSTVDTDKTPRVDCLTHQLKSGPHCQRLHGRDLKSPSSDACSLSSLKRSDKTPNKRPRVDCFTYQVKRSPHCQRLYGRDLKCSSSDACSLSSLKRSEGRLMEQKDTLFSTVDTDKTPRVDCLTHQVKCSPHCQRFYGRDLKSPSSDACSQSSMKRSEGRLMEQKDTLFSTVDTDETPGKKQRVDCFTHQVKRGPHCQRLYGKDLKCPSSDACPLSSLKRSEGRLMEQKDTLFSTVDTDETSGKKQRVDCFTHQVKRGPHCQRLYGKDLKCPSSDACPLSSLKRSEGRLMEQKDTLFSTVDTDETSGKKQRVDCLTHQVKRGPHCQKLYGKDLKCPSSDACSLSSLKRSVGRLMEQKNTLFSTVDTDETPGKRQRVDCFTHQVKSGLYNATSLHGIPSEFKTTQFVPKQPRVVKTSQPVYSVINEKSCSQGKISDREKTIGVILENESRTGHWLELDLSEKLSPPLHLTDGSKGALRRKLPILERKEKLCSGKLRDKRMDDDLDFTADLEKEISNALGPGPRDQILSCAFNQSITRGDIQTLKNGHWLNDGVINFYMNLLVERNKKQDYPALHAFSTFFYPKLKSGGYQAVKKWTKEVNLFDQEIILVPIHQKAHWSLVVIDLRKKCLKYLDSMGQKGHKVCEILLQYLQNESKTKRNTDLNLLEWTHFSMKPHEIPQQWNGNDCGVFTCKFADYISRDKPITFTQHQMPLFRKKMVLEILHQQLL
ncbi:sentrin-specific protease 2-like [Suncus etruscus]|uniref:sentrin-specific protease 2-like n=1 Tax=Suncus etruscus TaxID=109475 RepID=UPI0021109DAD|nr:sentrin-specific protease 2-like [Suncus etruscus]